ncbi:MAG: hypothetical protein K0Q79_1579 [Flavipsychrobacter sp.]|jgi:hypothetical protein|nr:hypothetical protein [Flavipsychrobacter sp.]
MEQQKGIGKGVPNKAVRFFKWLGQKITALFELEEVEVTFDHGSYTYRKVEHKHA